MFVPGEFISQGSLDSRLTAGKTPKPLTAWRSTLESATVTKLYGKP
ncbi:hypothetical protein AB434_3243 [Heyndrickxia coagulans]|uniref:Uncharacterized protein n=1 Tax=Heyndrickxia coagulans TaxID=1398 RepID=A0AAN0T843_HEYCO|nr:hypothetical protein SB48_HM08orf03241 [Heyndrickxia coagulans]AKN55648.1 hypothetical protein AB434_3243 [Heyndrickxia coagulans]KYC61198.1 hypothetical protein B4100_3298 [Heyndrickxia coagulans]